MFLHEDLSDRFLVLSAGEFPSRLFSDNGFAPTDWKNDSVLDALKIHCFDIGFLFPELQSDNYRGLLLESVPFFVKFLPTVRDCVAARIFAIEPNGNIVLVKSWKP